MINLISKRPGAADFFTNLGMGLLAGSQQMPVGQNRFAAMAPFIGQAVQAPMNARMVQSQMAMSDLQQEQLRRAAERERQWAQMFTPQGTETAPAMGAGGLQGLAAATGATMAGPQPTGARANIPPSMAPILSGMGAAEGYKALGDIAGYEEKRRIDQRYGVGKTQNPASIMEYEFYQSLPQDKREEYLNIKRAQPFKDIGGAIVQPSALPGGGVAQTIEKTLAPGETPEVRGAQAAATESAKLGVEREKNKPKAQSALGQLERQADVVTTTIDKAINRASSEALATGWGSMLLSGMPNTEARALKNDLDTIKANIGFDKLQQMRDASPTGGALGQVSEMENRLLQAVNGALDPLQQEQLVANLQTIRELYPQVLEDRRRAFEMDYGQGAAPNAAPANNLRAKYGLE